MEVVFITDSYYPNPSPNAICVGKLRREFERRGIKTTIIAVRTFSKSVSIPNDADVNFIEPDVYYSIWYEINNQKDFKKIRFMQYVFRLRGALYGLLWPLMSLSHLHRYKKNLKKILNECIDDDIIVIGVYKSLEAALAGAQVKKKYKQAKFVLYTLDAIAGSIIPSIYGSKKIAKRSIKLWERILFNSYDFLYLMKSHEETYTNDYYKEFQYKIRFTDIPLLDIERKCDGITSTQSKRLIFTGSMSKETADPRYLLELIDRISQDDIIIEFYGLITDSDILTAINESTFATYNGSLPHEEIVNKQEQAFALLNFGNFTPCGIPCKIFEYFSTGKPVISCFKIDDDASKPYMEKYPNALLIDERRPIDENAEKLISFLNSKFTYDRNEINRLYKDNTPAATVDMIISDALK